MNTNLLENAIAVSVTISKIGTRRKVDSRKVQIRENEGEQPEADSIAVSKELIDCESFDAITKLDGDFRTKLYRLALPNPLFRNGTYLVPIALLEDIDAMIEQYKQERDEKVGFFINEYDTAINDARSRLGGLFNPADYPHRDDVRSTFRVASQYIEIGLPASLGNLSPEIFKREQAAFNDKLVSAAEEITAAMRQSFRDLVSHMVDRLSPDETGKQKIFRDSLINNFRDFMNTFSSRNITGDDELQELVDKARSILNGTSPDQLRSLDSIREKVTAGMNEIKQRIDTMVTDAPKRKFSFDD